MIITNDEQTFGIFMEDVDNDIENNNDDLDDNNNEENNLEDNDEGPSAKDKKDLFNRIYSWWSYAFKKYFTKCIICFS